MNRNAQQPEEATQPFFADVARLMKAKGINRADLSRRLSVSPAYVSRILSGRVNCTIATLLSLSNALEAGVSFRLTTSGVASDSTGPGEKITLAETLGASAGWSLDRAESTQLAQHDPKVIARQVIRDLPAEVTTKVVEFMTSEPKRRGRRKGSGLIPDDERLTKMAELLVRGEAQSERSAARMVAAEEPGHSKEATARRIRRKYRDDREELEAEAIKRLQDLGAAKESTEKRLARQGPSRKAGAVRAGQGELIPMVALKSTSDFLDSLRRAFEISRDTVEHLRSPYIVEEMARAVRMQADLLQTGVEAAASSLAEKLRVEDLLRQFAMPAKSSGDMLLDFKSLAMTDRDRRSALQGYIEEYAAAEAAMKEQLKNLAQFLRDGYQPSG